MAFQKGSTAGKEYWERRRAEAAVAAVDEVPAVVPNIESYQIRRVGLADLPNLGDGLLDLMSQKWPHLSKNAHANRLRTACSDNNVYFIKTLGAVGMAMRSYEGFDNRPTVYSVFIWPFMEDRRLGDMHMTAVMRGMINWAKSCSASRFRVGDTLLTPSTLRESGGTEVKMFEWRL